MIIAAYVTSFTSRGATEVPVRSHQILCLPNKMTIITINCSEQQKSLSRVIKYCACHAKWPPQIWQKFGENSWNAIHSAQPIRAWSETDPSMIRDRSEHDPTMNPSVQPAAEPRLLFALAASILYWKIQRFALRLSFQISPRTALATKSHTWASPSTAPATNSDTCTKYCACHENWHFTFTLLLDDTYYLTIYRLLDDTCYLMICISWRYLLLDDTYYVTIPFTWRYLLLNDTYYLTIAITWWYLSWRYVFLDDTYYLTIPFT